MRKKQSDSADLRPPTDLQDHYGNLRMGLDQKENCLRQFVNCWGWKKDRPAMLEDLRDLLADVNGIEQD